MVDQHRNAQCQWSQVMVILNHPINPLNHHLNFITKDQIRIMKKVLRVLHKVIPEIQDKMYNKLKLVTQ